MSGIIAWTCKICGHHADGLSVLQYITAERDHVCKVADQIRRALPYWRRQPNVAVVNWLEDCARQADGMAGLNDFDVCDEPSSVKHALRVAANTPWEDE